MGSTGQRGVRLRTAKAALSILLAFAVVFGGSFGAGIGLGPAEVRGEAAGERFYDFENFAVGPLNGQHGWTNAGPEVTVTDQVYAVSGAKTMKIADNDKTKAIGARVSFDPIERGSVEWWVKADTADRLVMLLESAGPQGTKPVEWIGLLANRTIEYYDGAVRTNSSETYEPGKWYRFRVDFDAAAGKKTITVLSDDGLLMFRQDTAFRDTSANMVNVFRFATISTGLGTFYVDNVRIRDAALADPGSLSGLRADPESVQVVAGQTKKVHMLGSYTNGDVRVMNGEVVNYTSANPGVATASGGIVTGVSPGATVIAAVYGGAQAMLDVNVLDPNDVPPYKDLPLRPLQRTTDLNGLKIVVPAGQEWQALGERIATALQTRWGIQAVMAAPDRDRFRDGWTGNTLLLGSLGNNDLLARLYGMRASYADAVYPGDGGYQLLTAIDPFGLGGNTIIVGAGDTAGAALGVDRLLEIIGQQTTAALPWLAEAKLSDQAASYLQYDGNPSPADIQSALAAADTRLSKLKPTANNETDAKALHSVLSAIKIYGENYQLTGNPGFGEVYRKLLKGYASFLNRHPAEAKAQLNERSNMWTDGDTFIQNWTVMEASPLFTPLERKQIVSALYLTFEANARDGYLTGAAASGPRWNHQIFPALSLIAGSDYFLRYYSLAEASGWKQLGERIFTGNTSYISLDEGSDYLMHVPMTNIDYAMATGNLDFMKRSLRPSADLNALMIDNLGVMAGGGDTYPFGYSSSGFSWGHSQVMNAATWLYGDPLYRFLLERARTGPFPDQRMGDLDYPIHRYMAVKPDESAGPPEGAYPRVQASSIEPGIYDDLREKEQAPLDVALEDTFHKLTFREGFGLDDSYLILDGFSAGAHGHQDGNAILNYTANGRLFLTDRDYIENTPEHHTGLVVTKDGEQRKKPPLAELQWSADIDGIGLSRSVVPNYNGTDWQRSVVSPNGSFYVIYDDVTVNEAGDYVLKNLWQTLGTPNIRGGDRFEAEQQGVTMSIHSLDASDLRTQDRYGHFRKYWKSDYPYPYADQETVLSEVFEERGYEAGEKTGFINVLSSRKSGPALQTRRLNETTLEIRQQGEQWLAVQSELTSSDFASDGKFHLIGEGKLLAAEATRIRIGSQTLAFAQPVMFSMDTATGEWTTHSLRKDRVVYDAQGEPVREEALDSGTAVWSKQMLQRLERTVKDREHPREWKKPRTDHPEGLADWQRVHRFPEQVTDSAWGELNGDGMEELVLGGIQGAVQAINDAGQVMWSFAAAGRVNEVTIQQLNGQPVVFVATENWHVHALNAQGQELWSYVFPSGAAQRERKGNLLGVTNVRVAHVNGADQPPWVMVGTQYRYIYGLDSNGTLQYEDLLYYYGIEDMAFADFDGDGKEEGVYALEYAYYAYWNERVVTRGGSGGGPGWKVADVLEQGGSGGLPAFLMGTKQNEVRLAGYNGKLQELWQRNVGGEVNAIRHGDYNGDGLPEILAGSDGFQIYALNPDGTVRFRKALEDRVRHVDGWSRGGVTEYWAAVDRGQLVQLSEQGEIAQKARFQHPVAAIRAGEAQPKPWVVLENGDVYRYRR